VNMSTTGEKKSEKKEEAKIEAAKNDLPEKAPEPRGGIEDLRRMVAMIERAVASNQPRLIGRALRHNGPLRQQATKEVLSKAITGYVPTGQLHSQLLEQIALLPDTPITVASDSAKGGSDAKEADAPRTTIIPEVEAYLSLLVLTTLLRQGAPLAEQTLAAAQQLVLSCGKHNRRSLDSLRAKAFSYLGLAHERTVAAASSKQGSTASLRPMLLAAHRTACLQHDEMGQATLLNLLLRSLLEENQVEQAFKLVSKTNFPEKASNNQFCRYLYYTGRIAALQLEYGDAYEKLKSSLRKAPQNSGVVGFRRGVTKLMVIVGLLMGEVPERGLFNQPDYRVATLAPYLALTVAVREGNLGEFNRVVAAHKPTFLADKMYTLVVRLSHSVIKTGLRRISVSYSRISMADICAKLTLDSAASAESVCAKAIRDGVIDATIDHDKGWLTSNERSNVYATTEPQRAFHQRVEFCLAVRNEAVKAMRYPDDAFKPKSKAKPKDEEEKSPEEIAKEIEDELDDDEE